MWYVLYGWPVFQWCTGLASDVGIPTKMQHSIFGASDCDICMNPDAFKALEESLEEFINGFNPVP